MKAVVFDMDGVLFDTERIYIESWRETAKEKGIEDMEPLIIECIGLNRTDTIRTFQEHYGTDFDFEDFRAGYTEKIQSILKKEGLPVKPGVRELLKYLREHHAKVAVASSTRTEKVLQYLEETKLLEYFPVVIGGDKILHSKPQPDIYLLACEKLQADPAESFAIEDSLNGIRSAYDAGMKVIMVPDMVAPVPEAVEKTTAIKESLTAVKNWFEESKAFS